MAEQPISTEQLLINLGCTGLTRYRHNFISPGLYFEDVIKDTEIDFFIVEQNIVGYSESWSYFWPTDSSNTIGTWYSSPNATKAFLRLHLPFTETQTVTLFSCVFKVERVDENDEFTAKLTRMSNN
jgi:hypothetical protein